MKKTVKRHFVRTMLELTLEGETTDAFDFRDRSETLAFPIRISKRAFPGRKPVRGLLVSLQGE